MKRKIATIFGVLGFAALAAGLYLLYGALFFGAEGHAEEQGKFMLYAYCCLAGALAGSYIFLLFNNSKAAVAGVMLSHIAAIVVLYYSGSMLYFSIPYILLPFMGLMVRGIWGEKLAYTGGLWIDPLVFLSGIPFYAAELFTNHHLEPGAASFALAFILLNGGMIAGILTDAMKIKGKVKGGVGLAAGQPAPEFCLQNEKDETVCLTTYKGKHNLLLIFVRGEWCPMCHIMLRAYMKESAQFRQRNVFLLVVGPDPTGVNRKMAQDLKLDFHILSDPHLKVSHAFRLKIKASHLIQAEKYNESKEIPLPASFLIDKSGVIRYCSNPDKIGEVVKLNDIFPVLASLDKTQHPS